MSDLLYPARAVALHAVTVVVVACSVTVVVHRFTGPGPIAIVLSLQPPQSVSMVTVALSRWTLHVGDISKWPPARTTLSQGPDDGLLGMYNDV